MVIQSTDDSALKILKMLGIDYERAVSVTIKFKAGEKVLVIIEEYLDTDSLVLVENNYQRIELNSSEMLEFAEENKKQ